MGGGNVGEGVVVDLTRLPHRLEVRPSERLAVTIENLARTHDRESLRA